jgi:putative transposase
MIDEIEIQQKILLSPLWKQINKKEQKEKRKITKVIVPVNKWQTRLLKNMYSIIYFDRLVIKSQKDNQIIDKCIYSVLGIDMKGYKDILGIWICEDESKSFCETICNNLKQRGVTDIFIVCHNNLEELREAVTSIFPETNQQLCIISKIRNSTEFLQRKDKKIIYTDLKKIYEAVNFDEAKFAKDEFEKKWGEKYPIIMQSWDENWIDFARFFNYPEQIRQLICTTNFVEKYHKTMKKFAKTKVVFPTDDSIRKAVFVSVKKLTSKWTIAIQDWHIVYKQMIHFLPID